MPDTAFSFVPRAARPPKPRTRGLTEIRGPYYSAYGERHLADLFETMGQWIDGLKFAGGSFALMPPQAVKGMASLAHDHDIYVSTGGWIENVLRFGGDTVERYIAEAKALGFDVFGTVVDRSLPTTLTDLRRSAYAAGLNWSHRFHRDTYSLDGWLVSTRVLGSPEAIDATQRSSARYFQRPDNDYLTYDPTRTALSGFAGQLVLNKHAGDRWRFGAGIDTRSPGFEVNDIGYQRDADRTIQFTWLNRRWLKPGKVFRRFNLNFNQWTAWSYGWDRMGVGGNVNFHFELLNYWGGYGGINRQLGGLSTIFWSLMIVVSLKYVVLVMRADNRGEGGTMALLALATNALKKRPRLRSAVILVGLLGASLFFGETVLTPAISVVSAIEGLQVGTPLFERWVLPLSVVVLFGLFALQRGLVGQYLTK